MKRPSRRCLIVAFLEYVTKAFLQSAAIRACFLSERREGGKRERENTERGSGKARSIIDSPGTRELTVCLHEPASAGPEGCRGGGRGGRRGRQATGRMRRPTKTIITE